MNSEHFLIALLLICLLPSTIIPSESLAQGEQEENGPRTDLIIKFYPDVESAYAGLKACEVDLIAFTGWSMGLPLHDGQQPYAWIYEDAMADPDIQLAPFAGMDFVAFDFNNRETIPEYPGIRSPMTYLSFRQAIAHLVDKDYLVDEIKGGFAYKIDVPIPAAQDPDWLNPNVTGPNYPYRYDPWTAASLLDEDGFIQGSTPNPYYDPETPWSAEYIRTYPPDHVKAGLDLDPIIFCVRNDDLHRYYAALSLIDHLQKIGIPVNLIEGSKEMLYPIVMGDRNYHIYTSGYVVKKWPIYLYKLYHSKFRYPYGPNYVTGGSYPELDRYLEWTWYNETIEGSKKACKIAQEFMVNNCISVWLYSSKGYCIYKDLLGVVNMKGYGLINKYTFLKAYKIDGGPINVGLVNAPMALNVLYSSWIYDWIVLDRIYCHLLNEAPYQIARDQPWAAQDWHVGSWIDPEDGLNKTKVTYWLRKDVYWVKPLTGEIDYQLTAHDVEFSIWFIHAHPDAWPWNVVEDVHHTRIIDDFCIEVYFNSTSYWAYYWIGKQLPLLPKELWLQNFCELRETTIVLEEEYTPGDTLMFTEDHVVQTVEVTLDGYPLIPGQDYDIIAKPIITPPKIYRLLAIEGYFDTTKMSSARQLITALLNYPNWNNGSCHTAWYRSYIHLLSECEQEMPEYNRGRVTRANIINEIQNFLSLPADVRVFYYIGHGYSNCSNYFMDLPDGNVIGDYELNNLLPMDNTVVILDSCQSQEACNNIGGSGRDIMVACRKNESAWGWIAGDCDPGSWGWFTGQVRDPKLGVLGGLTNDINSDGWVTSSEDFAFAQPSTIQYAARWGKTQTPQSSIQANCRLVCLCPPLLPLYAPCPNWIGWNIHAYPGQILTVYYWTPHNDPSPYGFIPGEYTWEEKLEGCGMYYVAEFVPGIGGYIYLKANWHFFIETPPMGEIDFWWEWGPRDLTRPAPQEPDGPRTGYYHVGISDVVLCTGAYDAHGNLVPDPHWFPGADVALPECYIDISDVVVICAVYCTEFGHPPIDP